MKNPPNPFMQDLDVDGVRHRYASLRAAAAQPALAGLATLPFSLRILAENLLRHAASPEVSADMLPALARGERGIEIPFWPARVLLQDMLGVPVMVDLAALRDAVAAAGGDPQTVNPRIPVDFVIDHSLVADISGRADAAQRNVEIEYARNRERFAFLAWCQGAFRNLRVVPPDSGIVHQINVERLARVVWTREADGSTLAYPDTLVCNDSHTPMINGIGVLGWGVGGIEAEAAMLGRALTLRVPEVVGVRVTGALAAGTTATDLVLTITQQMRRHGVVGKFVEFYGDGLDSLPVSERATIANMAPEYGATCVYFPLDQACLDYLAFTGREAAVVRLVRTYAEAQGLWRDGNTVTPRYDAMIELDLSKVEPCLAGPRRPQERVPLGEVAAGFAREMNTLARDGRAAPGKRVTLDGGSATLGDGDIVIAAITSCTNTSNPANMITAGLVARNALARGLTAKPWIKTSFAPGSKVVLDYLQRAGLYDPLAALGFQLAGFGCTTCNGNSGPLATEIEAAVKEHELVSVAVLSGNRNFEGRVHPFARAAYLASPPLVVAYAIAGSITCDLATMPLGHDSHGAPVYLRELWPAPAEVATLLAANLTPQMYRHSYEHLFDGTPEWRALRGEASALFAWDDNSTFLRRPTYFDDVPAAPAALTDLHGLRPLAILGDMITTDHLAPAGRISRDSPAGRYLHAHNTPASEFHSYGIRRGNHEVAMRATLAAPRLKNEMLPGSEGGNTKLQPDGNTLAIFDAAEIYRSRGEAAIIIAGREYGAGSSRDWAAKGPAMIGVRAVVAESYEKIHRSNLVGMGVLPLAFKSTTRSALQLDGSETFDVIGIASGLAPHATLTLRIHRADGAAINVAVEACIDTAEELTAYRHGGILPQVYREFVADLK
ncbi:MAG: aconitate hydratase AcnA [Betaproteobacteria bacterium]